MILLLDSNALVWWLDDDPALSTSARSAIREPANEVIVSAAMVWELAIKRENGKIKTAANLADAVARAGFQGMPVTLADAEAAAALPRHHKDPFDRMLIAQAHRLSAVVVTRDRVFQRYEVDVLEA